MQIAKNKVVTIEYTLTDSQGTVLDSSKGRDPFSYVHGTGSIIPGVEAELEGKAPGDTLRIHVPPDKGYGERNDALVQVIPRNLFKPEQELEVGMQFEANTSWGPRLLTVTGIEGDNVTVDGNHPLAGQALNFDITVRDVRDATDEELSHGHAHGPGSSH